MKTRLRVATSSLVLFVLGAASSAPAQIDLSGSFDLQASGLAGPCDFAVTQNGSAIDLFAQCQFPPLSGSAIGTIDPMTGLFSASGLCNIGPFEIGTLQIGGLATPDSATFYGQLSCLGELFSYTATRRCPPSPSGACRAAGKSLLTLSNDVDGARDKLMWKWQKGAATTQDDFGVPTGTTGYALCVYPGAASGRATVPPTPSLWRPIGSKGWRYKDALGSADGVTRVVLKGGADGRATVQVKGKGAALPAFNNFFPVANGAFPVTVQLIRSGTNLCWESRFQAGDVTANTAESFRAKNASP